MMSPRDRTLFAHRQQRLSAHIGRVVTYALLGLWTLVCLFPLYWVAVTSLKGGRAIDEGPFYLPFVDFTPAFGSWAFVLVDRYDNVLWRFYNSAVVGLTSTLLTLSLGGLLVYGLTRFRSALTWAAVAIIGLAAALAGSAIITTAPGLRVLFAGAAVLLLLAAARGNFRGPTLSNGAIQMATLATRILPPIVVVLPLYLMAQNTGLLDTQFALIFAYTGANLPVAVWLLQPILGNAASEQEEAALLDGASHFAIFCTIVVPMAAAGIAAAGLLVFILAWHEYLFAAYLAGDHAMTMPPWVIGQMSIKEAQVGGDAEEWAQLSAAIVLMAIPVLALTGLAQRFLARISLWRR